MRHPLGQNFVRTEFVERDEFLKLLLSSRKMVRIGYPSKNVRGVVDLATKTRYLIEADKLSRRTA
jgi:hypothetical protein